MQKAQGDLPAALTSYQAAPRHHRPPGEVRSRQRRLAARFVGFVQQVGDVQKAQGDLPAALKSYQTSSRHHGPPGEVDPGNTVWQRDLAVSYSKLVAVYLKTAQPTKAREALASGRAIIARFVEK